uniref:ABC transporter domain-containing protein n=1 Tax=Setaria italica TaxID=4555 RepID=K3YG64_SETIT
MESRRSRGLARFFRQVHALFLKNLSFQRRNARTNTAIAAFPVLLCVLLVSIQRVVDSELARPPFQCGCQGTQCGVQYSTPIQALSCAVPVPPRWPALVQVPDPEARALTRLHRRPCNSSEKSCPAAVLLTGRNRQLAQGLGGLLFPPVPAQYALAPDASNSSDYLDEFSTVVTGSNSLPAHVLFVEPGLVPQETLYVLQPQCQFDSRNVSENFDGIQLESGYDFLDTNKRRLHVYVWYNSSFSRDNGHHSMTVLRVARLVNMASAAYLNHFRGQNVEMRLEYLKEMPKAAVPMRLDLTTLLDALFFTWTVQLLLPVMLTYLVYDKERRLRLMMKMHGLKDAPYWLISYAYFLSLSTAYMMFFMISGSVIGLDIFRLNSYSIQSLFYFICINLQIVLAFLLASFFSSVRIATVIGYIYVFGSSLLGEALLKIFIEDATFPRMWLVAIELIPGFSLYRGIYELSEYAAAGRNMGKPGMRWADLNDPVNGMKDVMILMSIEGIILLLVAFLLGHRPAWQPLFVFGFLSTNHSSPSEKPNKLKRGSRRVHVDMTKPDVFLERKVVKRLLKDMDMSNLIICHNLKKVYPGKNGNPDKHAVRGLSLALRKGQCFGMLGPNGAGKTSFINMMIGLVKPTYGTAYIHGMDLRTDMKEIYANIGVCPQHDLLWETLTGREHLMFYGRMKNLTGAALTQAVEQSLKNVNLFHSGFGDKSVSKYSGGMKRRLSVAIALIGNPKVVYMDEPSTGLDSRSRNDLWRIIKQAKKDCTIFLTTHSMEEAEELCDRIGIFINGNFHCIGTPKELKARYGGTRILTITTSPEHEEAVEQLVSWLSPRYTRIYSVLGTQKFALPQQEVGLGCVFGAVEAARRAFPVLGWGVADATLEEVFVRVAKEARAFDVLS